MDNPNSFRVLLGDFVTTEDGTGLYIRRRHLEPMTTGGKKYDIGILTMVDRQGKFVDGLGEFSNRYVKNYKDDPNYVDVIVDIAVKLKKRKTVPSALKNTSTPIPLLADRQTGALLSPRCLVYPDHRTPRPDGGAEQNNQLETPVHG